MKRLSVFRWLSALVGSLALLLSVCSVSLGQTTTGAGLFGSQNLGTSLTPGTGTRLSGTSRTGTGVGTSSSIPITSGQFLNIQSVNTAEQLFGNSNTFVGAEASEAFNPLSLLGTGTNRTGTSTGLTSRGTLSTLGRSTLGSGGLLGGGSLLGAGRSTIGSRTTSRFGSMAGRRTQQDVIRSVLRPGFSTPEPQPQNISTELTGRINRVSQLRSATGTPLDVQVSLEGRTAVLRGTVASANDRLVLERLLLLEPGIDKVQNELVVAGSTGR